MPETDAEARLLTMLPTLSEAEQSVANSLPADFLLDVPYFAQEKEHFSGAACIQMLQAFYEHPVAPQEQIVYYAGWRDWTRLNHESFSEDVDRFMTRANFLPATYYPGAFILRHFDTGPEGGDFIMQNRERVSEIDFVFFRMMLQSIGGPVFYRIHFTTEDYPMEERMAQRLDTAGHCILMVGWNDKGFLFHDPWNRERWGGKRGGPATLIPYETLIHTRPLVNCCKEASHGFTPLRADILEPRQAISQNREITLCLLIRWLGVESIMVNSYRMKHVSARIVIPDHFALLSPEVQDYDQELRPGQSCMLSWKVNVGMNVASFPVRAEVQGKVNLPAWPWETMSKAQEITITAESYIRLDVKSETWFNSYGRF